MKTTVRHRQCLRLMMTAINLDFSVCLDCAIGDDLWPRKKKKEKEGSEKPQLA